MRYRQHVVLTIDVDDDEPGLGTYGDPAGWPWEQIVSRYCDGVIDVESNTITPEVMDAGYAEADYEYRPGYWRYQYHEAQHVPYYVNVYEVDQGYGGPEEGGWWFSIGIPVEEACEVYETPEAAEIARKVLAEQYPDTGQQYSVLGGADYAVQIEDHPPRAWPETRPHYC